MRTTTKADQMTAKQVKEYLKGGGIRCPFCREAHLEGGSIEIDAGRAYQDVRCNECNAKWTDTYSLDGVI